MLGKFLGGQRNKGLVNLTVFVVELNLVYSFCNGGFIANTAFLRGCGCMLGSFLGSKEQRECAFDNLLC